MKNLLVILLLISCSHIKSTHKKMNVAFIQGSHLESSSWNEVIKYMPRATRTFELIERRELATYETTATLDAVGQFSCHKLLTGKNIVIAHSFGGAIVGKMVRICPEKFGAIIYISAVIPNNGEEIYQRVSEKDQKHYEQSVTFESHGVVPKDSIVFYKKMDSGIESLQGLPKPLNEPYGPMNGKFYGDMNKLKEIPKYYIKTMSDSVLEPKTQQGYIQGTNIEKVWEIKTGHLPMYSEPLKLSETIIKALNVIDLRP